MSDIKHLLGLVLDTAPQGKLLSVLFKSLKGVLDNKPMIVSPKASGKQLVLKGWLMENEAVSVRYSAEWKNPDGGSVGFKTAADKTYKPGSGVKVVFAAAGGKLTLKLSFKDSTGKAHVAKLYAEIL